VILSKEAMFKTVLFPVDMSPESQQVASTVLELVKLHQSRLIVLSVVEPSPEGQTPPSRQTSPEAVAELLAQAKERFSSAGIDTETLEREGQPAFIICDVADEINADLIVMGCRGVGLIEEVQEDSVAARVINLSPCPILIVP